MEGLSVFVWAWSVWAWLFIGFISIVVMRLADNDMPPDKNGKYWVKNDGRMVIALLVLAPITFVIACLAVVAWCSRE